MFACRSGNVSGNRQNLSLGIREEGGRTEREGRRRRKKRKLRAERRRSRRRFWSASFVFQLMLLFLYS